MHGRGQRREGQRHDAVNVHGKYLMQPPMERTPDDKVSVPLFDGAEVMAEVFRETWLLQSKI